MLFNTGQDETINVLHQPFCQTTSHCAESSSSGPKTNLFGWLWLEVSGEFCDKPVFAAGEFSLVAQVHTVRWVKAEGECQTTLVYPITEQPGE